MSEELLNIAKELSEKPMTELAIQFMELTADNIIKDKEIDRLNNIINELEKWCLSWKENDKYCYLASNDKDKCRYDIWEEVLDKLKELKENNK